MLLAQNSRWPVAIFSKLYQEIKLTFAQTAQMTAEAGLDGIDCPVRPGGQILPENAPEELPRLTGELAKRNVRLYLITTAILSPASPHAESSLRAAKKEGVTYYRLGYYNLKKDKTQKENYAEIRSQLKDLAAMNKELGMCGLLQNHAGNPVGAKVWDLLDLVEGLDPSQVALAFDIGHAIHELKDGWSDVFTKAQKYVQICYIKDYSLDSGWTSLGKGAIESSGFLQTLKASGYNAPISLHIEYDWSKGKPKTFEGMLQAIQSDLGVWKKWMQKV